MNRDQGKFVAPSPVAPHDTGWGRGEVSSRPCCAEPQGCRGGSGDAGDGGNMAGGRDMGAAGSSGGIGTWRAPEHRGCVGWGA